MTVDTGTRLNDRYRLTDRIAVGGMGEVWRARDEVLDRDVAVKLLKPEYTGDATFLARFRAEARHTAALAHPGIAGVYDYGEVDGTAYLVMELVPGDPLSAVLATESRLAPDRTLDVVAQAARALEVAHQAGVVHRDIKPGNILVCPDGTVKLTDFGIARAADAVPLTHTGMVMGTAHYIAPEQANGAAVTFASDVYSLGVVAYECLAGRRPFEAETPIGIAMAHLHEDPVALPADVPGAVSGLVAKAMAKDPDDRYPSAAAFAQAADAVRAELDRPATPSTMMLPAVDDETVAISTGAPPTAETPGTAGPAGGRGRGLRGPAIAAVALAVLFVLGVMAFGALKDPPKVTVPNVRNESRADARAALERRDLDVVEKAVYSSTVRRGNVVRQDPAAGTVLRAGDDVSITISRGPQPVTLPGNLTGRPVDDVTNDLEKLGLVVKREARAAEQPFGTVLSVTPTDDLHRGDTVTVHYSLGEKDGDDDKGRGKGKDKDD